MKKMKKRVAKDESNLVRFIAEAKIVECAVSSPSLLPTLIAPLSTPTLCAATAAAWPSIAPSSLS